MSIKITAAEMTSDVTRHTATAWPVPDEPTGWSVTWLPGRNLTRNQAITAMTIAEAVIAHVDELADSGSRWWLHIDGWAAELGVTGPHAVAAASESPEAHAAAGDRDKWFEASVMHGAVQPGALTGSASQPDAQARAAVAEVRGRRRCPLCDAAPGEPCQPKPEGDHLARWLDAYTASQLTRGYMHMVLGELVVIDVCAVVTSEGLADPASAAGTIVARIYDDAPCPLTGRVVGQIDEDRLEVAWGDEQFSDIPRTSTEWFDELRPVRTPGGAR